MRFYATYADAKAKRKRSPPTGVVIVFNENGFTSVPPNRMYDAVCTITDKDSSQICGTTVSDGYLASTCRRVSRSRAEELSPRMLAAFAAGERYEREAQRRIKKGEK